MSQELPPQVQNQLLQLQQLQQQAQMISAQKAQLTMELKEIELALKELEKVDDKATVFKSIGGIKETLEVRIKTLERQEERIKKRFDEIQNKMKGFFQPAAQ